MKDGAFSWSSSTASFFPESRKTFSVKHSFPSVAFPGRELFAFQGAAGSFATSSVFSSPSPHLLPFRQMPWRSPQERTMEPFSNTLHLRSFWFSDATEVRQLPFFETKTILSKE